MSRLFLLRNIEDGNGPGQWKPWYREGHLPPSPPPHHGGSSTGLFMGYTMVTRLAEDGSEYRYTEWPKFIAVGKVNWTALAGRELYNHSSDYQENWNVAEEPASAAVVAELSTQLRAGWRAARVVRWPQ
jgi:hypothetical protein